MNYQETLDYLFSQLPMYQRIGKAAYKADLNNTIELCKLLGNPEKKFKSIHVAGTNGKGSTSHYLASILQEAGYKVGLYTSPHLVDFRERIKINGKMISETAVVEFVSKFKDRFEKIGLSFFEMTVGLAFDHFANEHVDIAIIETGLGGRLDSTNVITPEISIITNIGLDHTQFLGDTPEKIAIEKAGIIKQNIPVVIGETQDEITNVFIRTASEKKATIIFADQQSISFEIPSNLPNYQKKNIKTVLESFEQLKSIGWEISNAQIESGINNMVNNTGLHGRWQTLRTNPLTICDTGHNEAGIKYVLEQIENTPYNTLRMVIGFVNDKSVDQILSMLPKNATYYFCQASIPRSLDHLELQKLATKSGLAGQTFSTVNAAISKAFDESSADDLVFIGGSTFVVADALQNF